MIRYVWLIMMIQLLFNGMKRMKQIHMFKMSNSQFSLFFVGVRTGLRSDYSGDTSAERWIVDNICLRSEEWGLLNSAKIIQSDSSIENSYQIAYNHRTCVFTTLEKKWDDDDDY